VTALSECEPVAAPGGGTRQTGRGWLVWCDDPQLSVGVGLDAQVASRWEAVQVQLDNVTALRDDAQARGWDSETTRHGRVVDSIEGQLRRINVDTGAGLFLPLDAEHESRLMRAGGSGTAAAGVPDGAFDGADPGVRGRTDRTTKHQSGAPGLRCPLLVISDAATGLMTVAPHLRGP